MRIKFIEKIDLFPNDQHKIFWRWLRNYVGQWCPRLRITINNSTNESLSVNSVIYNVKVYKVLSSNKGNYVGLDRYVNLPCDEGSVSWNMDDILGVETFVIPPHSIKEFHITLIPDSNCAELSYWDGDLKVKIGNKIEPICRLILTTYNPSVCYINL